MLRKITTIAATTTVRPQTRPAAPATKPMTGGPTSRPAVPAEATRASELPRNTSEVARPDCPGGASRAATGAMADQNTPCANAQHNRLTVRISKVGASPAAHCEIAKTATSAAISRRRGMPMVTAVSGMVVIAAIAAYVVSSSPTSASGTDSPWEICGSSPTGSVSAVTYTNADIASTARARRWVVLPSSAGVVMGHN